MYKVYLGVGKGGLFLRKTHHRTSKCIVGETGLVRRTVFPHHPRCAALISAKLEMQKLWVPVTAFDFHTA